MRTMVNSTQTKLVYSGAPSTTKPLETKCLNEKEGNVIKRDDNLRYRGIVFDRSLSGKDHISWVVKPAKVSTC